MRRVQSHPAAPNDDAVSLSAQNQPDARAVARKIGAFEYSLRNSAGPVGVAEYKLLVADALPAALADALPTAEEIETGTTATRQRSRR